MKIGEIAQRVQSLYSKGVASDDTRLSQRHIYNKLLTTRAKLISEQAKKKQRVSQWNYQTISCIELIKVPAHECPCLPPIGCDILRSKYKLPKPLTGLSGSLIQTVTTIDRGQKLNEVSINAVKSLTGNKYTSKNINYFIEQGYLYITTPSKIEFIRLIGLFEDPISAKQFENYCKENCDDCTECIDYQEEDFPIDNDMVDALIELTVQELVILFGQSQQDETNDSSDNASNNRRKQ